MSAARPTDTNPPSIQRQLALLTLLGDDDPVISGQIREQLMAGGQATLDWLHNHRFHDEPVIRRRIREIFDHFAAARADSEFLSFVLTQGEHLDLEQAVWLFTRTRFPDAPIEAYRAQLDEWAERIRVELDETRASTGEETLKVLNRQLFTELKFTGNEEHYYDPANSYVNCVMDRRTGIPISLCLIYLFLTRRLSLPVSGIGMPGHFLCRFQTSREEYYIDAFHGGQLLTRIDCLRRLKNFAVEFDEAHLQPISPRRIVQRMIANLHLIHKEKRLKSEADRLQRYLVALAR